MNFTTKDLETILYSLEGYMQGNDDNELVEELDSICYRIMKTIRGASMKQLKYVTPEFFHKNDCPVNAKVIEDNIDD